MLYNTTKNVKLQQPSKKAAHHNQYFALEELTSELPEPKVYRAQHDLQPQQFHYSSTVHLRPKEILAAL